MKITFRDSKIGDACNDPQDDKLDKYIEKARAPFSSDYIRTVLAELRSCPNPAFLPCYYHYELLKHDFSGCASITLKAKNKGGRGQWRMILRPISSTDNINDNNSITEVIVEDLINNHYGRRRKK